MRLRKAEDLLQLMMWLQAAYSGVSLWDIQEEFGVSRRTAERMRDAVSRLLPDIEENISHDGRKRWKLPRTRSLLPIRIDAQDLASLEIARKSLERDNLKDKAKQLVALERKFLALADGSRAAGREVDLEALLEAEGLAMRSGPRPRVSSDVLETLRLAILRCEKVTFRYKARGTKKLSRPKVSPYGFLYGNRHYLLAYSTSSKIKNYRLYVLSDITSVKLLGEYYERRPDFSLQQYAERSFGVFQGEVFPVELIFSQNAAEDASTYVFHPSQRAKKLKDGRFEVCMNVSGLRELAWHLVTWGQEVEVTSPERLRKMVVAVQKAMAKSSDWQEKDS